MRGKPQACLFYDDDAHVERIDRKADVAPGAARGLVGRQVASSEFFQAYLTHGDWDRMVAVVRNEHSRNLAAARFMTHPRIRGTSRQLEVIRLSRFHERFFPDPPARVLHLPEPVEVKYAWIRDHAGRHAFALSGITHTISSLSIAQRFCDLVTAPFEAYDTLFCISNASIQVVRAITDNYAAFLRERHGGDPRVRVRLAHVPLGIDTDKFRPATPPERAAMRNELGIPPDAICVLFVGRLTYNGKVHPFPMFRGVVEAAARTGQLVHLVLAGWAEDGMLQRFRQGADVLAAGVRTTIVDGTRPEYRFRVWHAADVFTSLTDNIQETLSQTILEAQACGLPVVVTDWDGCRDEVAPGETGLLVPARALAGATRDGSSRYILGQTSYAEFLAETNQTIGVDVAAASSAFARLFEDSALRRRMGIAARQRILEHFTWQSVVRQYEDIWREQEILRQEHAAVVSSSTVRTPVLFPDVEHSFASYPSEVLDGDTRVVAADDAVTRLDVLLSLPITNYRPRRRVVERERLVRVIEAASQPCAIQALDRVLDAPGERGRATIAWMLKYDLLRVMQLG